MPSAYVVRKINLLRIVYDWSDIETIRFIMSEAPSSWSPILGPHFCTTIVEFQNTVKYHEENLIHASATYQDQSRHSYSPNRNNYPRTRTNLVGWTKDMTPPEFPKDDQNVSRKMPESIGAPSCHYCGSGKHWDKECRHAKKGERCAHTKLATVI